MQTVQEMDESHLKGANDYSDKASQNSDYVIDKKAERKLVRKLDLYLVPILFFLYLLCFIDR